MLIGQPAHRFVHIDAVGQAHRLQHRVQPAALAAGPRADAAFPKGQIFVDDQFRVDIHAHAQAVALGTRAVRAVERKHARGQFLDADAAVGARQLLAEQQLLRLRLFLAPPAQDVDDDQPVGSPQSRFDGIGQPALDAVAHHDAVHDDLDPVFFVFVQIDGLGRLPQFAVHPHPHEPFPGDFLQELLVLAFATPHDGREHLQARAFAQRRHLVDDLLHRLLRDGLAAVGAVGFADARVQQPQVVVHFRHGAHRRARIAAGRLLVDGDRGRQAFDKVHVGFVHLPEKLARVRGQRLHVAALAFGVNRIERQRRLARARQTGEHHQLVPRNLQIDVFQVVLASATYNQFFCRHRRSPFPLRESRRAGLPPYPATSCANSSSRSSLTSSRSSAARSNSSSSAAAYISASSSLIRWASSDGDMERTSARSASASS